ncbi:MAG: hypothetical protein OI715_00490 (plasmid) [Candidatus Methanoperedens sp.]|nr:MAG: hypothetical protein OI715_00490 [Candidatus Methanoperedens sp.]
MSKVVDLLKCCNEKIKSNRIKLFFWSFWNNFEGIQEGIYFYGFDKEDFDKFIEICDNRLKRSKVFLNDIAVVLGFDFLALSIIATVLSKSETDKNILSLLWSLLTGNFLIEVLLIILIFLFGLLVHYRSQIHAWTAFKEKAILMR